MLNICVALIKEKKKSKTQQYKDYHPKEIR